MQIRDAGRVGAARGVPLFFCRSLGLKRNGRNILPLFFSLNDLEKTWRAACSSTSNKNINEEHMRLEVVDLLDLLLRAAFQKQVPIHSNCRASANLWSTCAATFTVFAFAAVDAVPAASITSLCLHCMCPIHLGGAFEKNHCTTGPTATAADG